MLAPFGTQNGHFCTTNFPGRCRGPNIMWSFVAGLLPESVSRFLEQDWRNYQQKMQSVHGNTMQQVVAAHQLDISCFAHSAQCRPLPPDFPCLLPAVPEGCE